MHALEWLLILNLSCLLHFVCASKDESKGLESENNPSDEDVDYTSYQTSFEDKQHLEKTFEYSGTDSATNLFQTFNNYDSEKDKNNAFGNFTSNSPPSGKSRENRSHHLSYNTSLQYKPKILENSGYISGEDKFGIASKKRKSFSHDSSSIDPNQTTFDPQAQSNLQPRRPFNLHVKQEKRTFPHFQDESEAYGGYPDNLPEFSMFSSAYDKQEDTLESKMPDEDLSVSKMNSLPELVDPPLPSNIGIHENEILASVDIGIRYAKENIETFFTTVVKNNSDVALNTTERTTSYIPSLKILAVTVEKDLMIEELICAAKLVNIRYMGDLFRGMAIIRMILTRIFLRVREEFLKFSTDSEASSWDYIGSFMDSLCDATMVIAEVPFDFPRMWQTSIKNILSADDQSRPLLEAFRGLFQALQEYRQVYSKPIDTVPLAILYRRHLQMELLRLLGPSLARQWQAHAIAVLSLHYYAQSYAELRQTHLPLTPAVARAVLWMAPTLIPSNIDVGLTEASSALTIFEAKRKRRVMPPVNKEFAIPAFIVDKDWLDEPISIRAIMAAHLRYQYLYPRLTANQNFTFAELQASDQKTDLRMLADLLLHLELGLVTPIGFDFSQLPSMVQGLHFENPSDASILQSFLISTGFISSTANLEVYSVTIPLTSPKYMAAVLRLHLILQEHVLVPIRQSIEAVGSSISKSEARAKAMEILGIPPRVYLIAKQVRKMAVDLKRERIDAAVIDGELLHMALPFTAPPSWTSEDLAQFKRLFASY